MWKWECSPNLSPYGVRYSGAEEQCLSNGKWSFQVDDERVSLRMWRVASDMQSKGLLSDGGKHWDGRSELKGYLCAEWPGFWILAGGREFSFLRRLHTGQIGSQVLQTHTKLVPMALFPGIKRSERENNRLIQSNAVMKDDCNHNFTPPIFLRENPGKTYTFIRNDLLAWNK